MIKMTIMIKKLLKKITKRAMTKMTMIKKMIRKNRKNIAKKSKKAKNNKIKRDLTNQKIMMIKMTIKKDTNKPKLTEENKINPKTVRRIIKISIENKRMKNKIKTMIKNKKARKNATNL
jgi:hypothetical protein